MLAVIYILVSDHRYYLYAASLTSIIHLIVSQKSKIWTILTVHLIADIFLCHYIKVSMHIRQVGEEERLQIRASLVRFQKIGGFLGYCFYAIVLIIYTCVLEHRYFLMHVYNWFK